MTGNQAARIAVLDALTANQIAAGEVVERPAAVVKELVENSLDAAARHIDVEIAGGGLELIRVRDDGLGIGREDAPLAFARHATSKIRRATDLARITTLGFRGEALASIAAVARVEMTTRPLGETAGTLVRVAGDTQPEVMATGCPPGTTVTVRDLFFNTPARRQYLKKPAVEARTVMGVVEKLALGHPEVALTLSIDGRRSLATPGNSDLQAVLVALYGLETGRELLPLQGAGAGWSLQGFISPPWMHRSHRNQQVWLVNGRYILSRVFTWAVEGCYRSVIPAGRHPLFILQLTLDPGEVDVNVHPTKLEVRFQKEQDLARQVTNLVKGALFTPRAVAPATIARPEEKKATGSTVVQQDIPFRDMEEQAHNWGEYILRERDGQVRHPLRPEQNTTPTGMSGASGTTGPGWDQAGAGRVLLELEPVVTGEGRTGEKPLEEGETNPDKSPKIGTWRGASMPSPPVHPDGPGKEGYTAGTETAAVLPPLQALGQVFNTYILAAGGDGLYIIDQHAAHERCRFEALFKESGLGGHPAQMLEPPLTLHLAPEMLLKLVDQIVVLRELGFIVEEFGTNTFLLRSVPLGIPPGKEREVLEDFLADSNLPVLERLYKLIACHGAIKAGEPLARVEMQRLLEDLRRVNHPYTCPHGRPAIVRLDQAQLARYFQRPIKTNGGR
ncbi:DNA mismatch repair endonuclease MutL [Moorella naiadis]|uniref:DNA mismatch repair endonuclease MutL n=1 Tax=Moorella naiadis (nom. illeg.) TaxID=3093670 RepID=UPI003D9CB92F